MENVRWIAAAALSAYACFLAVHHTTPIDHALPLLAVALTLLAWLSYPALMIGVPMLIAAEIAIPDERIRLIAFGAVMAVAVASCVLRVKSNFAPVVAVIAIVLLRWIPLDDVLVGRELFLLALALAIVFVLGRTPFAVAIAVVCVLITPAVPLRTLAFPLTVLIIAATARTFGMPAFRLAWPSTMVVAFAVLFFSWSGIVARAFPYFLREWKPPAKRTLVESLAANISATYHVPDGAKHIVMSGANVASLRRGDVVGKIEPGSIPIRIGDVADWGYMRREQWYRAHNPLPRDAAGQVREYGYAAWIDGAGRVALPRGARTIRVTADAALPAGASLQVEGFE